MSGHSGKSEPADPSYNSDLYHRRRDTPIAPTYVDPDRLPKPLVKCGCDDCSDSVSPLADDNKKIYAADVCAEPTPMTVREAAEVYLRYQQSAWNTDNRTSLPERYMRAYASLLETDRQLRLQFDNLTTVLLSRRVSPISNGKWITPFEIDERLHGNGTNKSVVRSLRYHLRDFDFEYVGVTATTDSAATPHEHIYVWINDPNNTICASDFKPVIDKHTRISGATEEDHLEGKAITVRHDPPLVNSEPDKIDLIQHQSLTTDGGSVPKNTQGAQYLASQLPHVQYASQLNGGEEAKETDIDGGAMAWATPHNSIRSSNGSMRKLS